MARAVLLPAEEAVPSIEKSAAFSAFLRIAGGGRGTV
mgnify:FL=1